MAAAPDRLMMSTNAMMAGSGACTKRRIGEWVRVDGRRTLLDRMHATWALSDALGFGVVPECVLQSDEDGTAYLQRRWVDGWEGCGLDDALTPRGVQIAILDYLVFNRDRTLHHNVIRGADHRLWAIDHEHCFEPAAEVAAPEWEIGGGSAFLHLWTLPALWYDHTAITVVRDTWARVRARGTDFYTPQAAIVVLGATSRAEARRRVRFLNESEGDVGRAWIRWRTDVYETLEVQQRRSL